MNNLSKLRTNLTEYFSLDELESLCFDVGIDKDDIPGKDKGKDNFITELLSYVQRRELVPQLLVKCCQTRPRANWEDVISEIMQSPRWITPQPRISFANWLRSKWTITLIAAVAVVIMIILFRPPPPPQISCDKYGVKIVSPIGGDITLPVRVSGVFDEIPDGSTIYVSNAYRGAGVSYYRPEERATVDRQKKIWYSDVDFIGDKGDSPDIVALLAGADGQILIEYHFKVGNETKIWPAITKLPQDTTECDSVRVTIP